MLLTVGEITMSQWIATARLKLGSPQPIRCYPAMAYLLHWVRGAQRNFSTSRPVNPAPRNKKTKDKKTPALRLASWNVRTMCPGITADLQLIDDARKTAIIDRELARLNIDIACLQETRLPESGTIKECNYTFFWQGGPMDTPRQHGVGFAIKNGLCSSIEPPTKGTNRILTIRLSTSSGLANIISAYAPTLSSSSEAKDQFYDDLNQTLASIPTNEAIYILGDFNARVGSDHMAWPTCLGYFGRGRLNENGQRLLEMCCLHGLCVTNTFFNCKAIHQVSWRHPRSKHWHQLDLIITRRTQLASVLLTRSYHSADCDTDHSLVASKVRLLPKKLYRNKNKGKPRIGICSTKNPERTAEYTQRLKEALVQMPPVDTIESKWSHLRDTIYGSAIAAFGKRERKSADWFEAHWEEMKHVTDVKRKALLAYKDRPCPETLHSLKSAKKNAQQAARHYANTYWLNLSSSIQSAADRGDTKAMYENIKQATGPLTSKTAPLMSKAGEIITDRDKQLKRWIEHYLELYATINHVSTAALDDIPDLPVMEELDSLPTMVELSRAIDCLACGKAPGNDGIPPEVLKCGKEILLQPLHDLLTLCWEQGQIPQELKDANIVTLYKNKGDKSDCNNYRGISLLSIVGKAFARVALTRLQTLASRVLPESQCGFRAGRSTIDMIFSLRQLQEKCREQHMPLYIAFVDLTKAFDLVSRSGLFQILVKIGCPTHLLNIIKQFHENMQGTVCYNGATSEAFPVSSGVKQGCVLAPTLFAIFFSILLQYAFKNNSEGIYIHTRADGRLFNIARLKAKTKIRKILLRELLFADDAALISHTADGLQNLVSSFSAACKEFGLTISIKKTNIMAQDAASLPTITIDDCNLDAVDSFTYLGSNISSTLSLEDEISSRIGKAATVMARLYKRVWSNAKLTARTKLQVYQACVLSTLLYGCESWTTYTRHERRLNSFHLRCLRRILDIKWQEKVPNTEVLAQASMSSIAAILSQRRLRWLGHVKRMQSGRIPKDVLYSELATGKRSVGRPCLRYVDICKRDMKVANIDIQNWENLAEDRSMWRAIVKEGSLRAEEQTRAEAVGKRARRKARQHCPTAFVCVSCRRDCHSRIGLISHTKSCK